MLSLEHLACPIIIINNLIIKVVTITKDKNVRE
jgi:hypothetical protein